MFVIHDGANELLKGVSALRAEKQVFSLGKRIMANLDVVLISCNQRFRNMHVRM